MPSFKDIYINATTALTSGLQSVYSDAKKRVVSAVVNQFAPDIMEAGTKVLTEKVKEAITTCSPLTMLSKLVGSDSSSKDPSISSIEQGFNKLLVSGRKKLTEQSENTDPAIQAGVKLASTLLDTLEQSAKEFATLKNKTAARFQQESLDAIRKAQPELEKLLSQTLINAIINPFISFFTELLKTLFSPNQPPPVSASVPANAPSDVEVDDNAEQEELGDDAIRPQSR